MASSNTGDARERSMRIYGKETFSCPLPFFSKTDLPNGDPTLTPRRDIGETCGGKIISGAFIGAFMGVGLGLFMGAMGGDTSAIEVIKGREVPPAPLREQMRSGYKATGAKAKGWAKQFGVLTALFGGVECVVEKYRAKHDVWNPVISGCAVGATLSASGGPGAACLGCAGFAGFSYLIDKVIGD
mmetsp:Transcript_3233/g.5713  ORF Transcript_3233/g.5713 Transcript_3233/m.5713 type:complete len:185 (+) Transcript_3233:208-762(+)|eukprot:CAMPEP_0114421662 /NCGR_PEP_ID=MMETSP0103-20121206/5198_1 /TAXON_ID=37642 ORGANISM="Paraphysomonas imperforata, Strain PA2" /NCGR_SAMPLE_ID=MMETSP0103 /ASSEMBLY_ACC=CAM_ASM_000201 /LENGTH=184 /DNA_ID=CAMNT_0001590199 /DNA_START=207 /DNA_END=761 /DNA_ORIENTATION=-